MSFRLDVSENQHLSVHEMAAALFNGLRGASSLKFLDLSRNEIGHPGGRAIPNPNFKAAHNVRESAATLLPPLILEQLP
jgi:hypothetical protein